MKGHWEFTPRRRASLKKARKVHSMMVRYGKAYMARHGGVKKELQKVSQ